MGYIVPLDSEFSRVIASRWIRQPRFELGLLSKQHDERVTLALLNLWNWCFLIIRFTIPDSFLSL